MLGNAMLFLLRGVPVVYYGDEQGFVGHGIDQAARQDMFASKVASYNDQTLLGTSATTASANFDAQHPLYRQIASLAALRTQHAALRRGRQVVRAHSKEPGLFAVSRFDSQGREVLMVFNTSTTSLGAQVEVAAGSAAFTALAGKCGQPVAAGSLKVELPPLGYAVCKAGSP